MPVARRSDPRRHPRIGDESDAPAVSERQVSRGRRFAAGAGNHDYRLRVSDLSAPLRCRIGTLPGSPACRTSPGSRRRLRADPLPAQGIAIGCRRAPRGPDPTEKPQSRHREELARAEHAADIGGSPLQSHRAADVACADRQFVFSRCPGGIDVMREYIPSDSLGLAHPPPPQATCSSIRRSSVGRNVRSCASFTCCWFHKPEARTASFGQCSPSHASEGGSSASR